MMHSPIAYVRGNTAFLVVLLLDAKEHARTFEYYDSVKLTFFKDLLP